MQSTFWPIPHLTRPIFVILHRERIGEEFSKRGEGEIMGVSIMEYTVPVSGGGG
jgi:hypothetical protein